MNNIKEIANTKYSNTFTDGKTFVKVSFIHADCGFVTVEYESKRVVEHGLFALNITNDVSESANIIESVVRGLFERYDI